MPQTVEINLRIPSLRIRREGEHDPETITNSDVRFGKRVEVAAVPKPGEVLEMSVGSGKPFEVEVVRSDWHEEKSLFVVACRYAKRSILQAEYEALMNAPDWEVRALL